MSWHEKAQAASASLISDIGLHSGNVPDDSCGDELRSRHSNVRQVPVLLVVVDPVAHNESIRTLEADTTAEEWLHRCGRDGRFGVKGVSVRQGPLHCKRAVDRFGRSGQCWFEL